MKLLSRNIVIDTRFFLGKSLDFKNQEILALHEIVKKGLANVYLTDITEREILKKISEDVAFAYSKLLGSDVRYLKSIPLFNTFLNTYSEKKAVQYITDSFRQFLKDCNVTIISSDSVKVKSIFENYCQQFPPFNSDKSKSRKYEFPDAFALDAILNRSIELEQKTYLLSGDSDWVAFSQRTFINSFNQDSELWLNSISSLSEFLDMLIRNESELVNITSFSDKLIETNLDEIKKWVLDVLSDMEIVDCNDDPEIEKINHYVLGVTFAQKEIISVNRNNAAYTIDFEVDLVVEYLKENWDGAAYDTDEGHFRGIKRGIIYQRFGNVESFNLKIEYNGGVPGNFKVISMGPSSIPLYVNYDQGEDFQPDLWALSLPVVVCGVFDRKITENGEGIERYKNFNEAKLKYPDLDIYKGSKLFSRALGNKINEELRFETLRASALHSG